jgi:ferredoxin
LIEVRPLISGLLVQCRKIIAGDEVLDDCKVACTACGKCVMDAAPGLISVASGVAAVDYRLNDMADAAAIARCPTGAIVWLRGAQFAPGTATEATPSARARVAPQLIGSRP